MLNAKRFYGVLLTGLLLLQLYLPSFRANILIQLGLLAVIVYFDASVVSVRLLRYNRNLLWIFALGFAGLLWHLGSYDPVNVIKDIFHIIKPILGLGLGYLLCRKLGSVGYFLKCIIVAGVLSAIAHYLILIFTGSLLHFRVEDIREFGKDNFLELFSLFFLITWKRFTPETLFRSRWLYLSVLLLLLSSNLLYFSRTMIIVALLLWLTFKGWTVLTERGILTLSVFVVLIGLMYAWLYSANIQRGRPGLEGFLYKIKIAPAELFVSHIDREDHRDLWDHWRAYEGSRALALMQENPESYVFGTGLGSLVNLKFFAPLSGQGNKGMKYISELHNGYYYVLYKFGILGLLLLLAYLRRLYAVLYENALALPVRRLISAIGLIYFFTGLTITGIYNPRDIMIFLLGAFFFISETTRYADPR